MLNFLRVSIYYNVYLVYLLSLWLLHDAVSKSVKIIKYLLSGGFDHQDFLIIKRYHNYIWNITNYFLSLKTYPLIITTLMEFEM